MSDNITNRINSHLGCKGLMLLLGEIVALGLVVAYTAPKFDFIGTLSIVLAFAVAYLVPRFIYSQSKISCRWGQWMLLIVGTAVAFYSIYSMKMGTMNPDDTLEMPALSSDSGGYYAWALSHYDGRCPSPQVTYCGISMLMVGLWKVLGVSVVWPLALNYMCLLLTIVMTGKIAHRLLSSRFTSTAPSTIAASAMLMTALMGFLVSQAMRIQKEAYCALGFALVGYALEGMCFTTLTSKEKRRDTVLFLLGTLIVAFVRTNYVYFIVIGAAMMAFANKCANWKRGTLMAVIALIFTFLFNYLFCYTLEHQYLILEGGETMAHDFKIGGAQQPYVLIIGDYYFFPKWERLLLLPITAGVQYIIPFPWLYDYSNATVLTLLPRMRLMWYIVGDACIFYYLYINAVHYKRSNMGMWAWWPLVTFMLMSFITGGLVSRYALPIQPLFVVVALYVLLHIKEGNYRRSFSIWMIVYSFILVATLIFCYHTQVEFLKSQHIL